MKNRVTRIFDQTARRVAGYDPLSGLRIDRGRELHKLGSVYGGWIVPGHVLNRSSVCYCAGVGEDITFDLSLIESYGCDVFAFDPTPRAVEHVKNTAVGIERYHFSPIGLWDEETALKFYAPKNSQHVSHSALNLQGTSEYFEADCKPVSVLMRENGHDRLDLLKLDIEGAEYRVVDSLLRDEIDLRVLCVEYDEAHQPLDKGYRERIAESARKLEDAGFRLISVDGRSNYTFCR